MRKEQRLIYAGEALDRLRRLAREPYYQHEGEDWSVGVSMACGEVHECATVDAVAVVHGQWVEINQHKDVEGWIECDYVCSDCGEIAGEAYNYCPNCGAKNGRGRMRMSTCKDCIHCDACDMMYENLTHRTVKHLPCPEGMENCPCFQDKEKYKEK